MKLNELAVANPTKQAAKVFESYFGKGMDFNSIGGSQARTMLKRVRNLIAEHRRTTQFHSSERNPAYLKLVVMEQALAARVSEQQVGMAAVTTAAGTGAAVDPLKSAQGTAAMATMKKAEMKRQSQEQGRAIDKQIADLNKQKADLMRQAASPVYERNRLKQRLKEASEVQQAQVVLASQDMVDQVQKMSEQISAMQFKDLPALVDQIKNEVGVDQAMQFNTDATAALAGLLQNLQGTKTQLEQALGVVTGQAPQVPGQDMTAPVPGEEEIGLDAEIATPDGEEDIDAEMDANIEPVPSTLGRGRR